MDAFSHVTFAAKSDIGRKRKNNEDAFGTFPSVGVFCVADGMGGGDDGEVASAATVRAIETFAKECPLPQRATYSSSDIVAQLRSHLNAASSWIFERAKEKHLKGCGSTFVGVCFDAAHPEAATVLHAGDSRLYRIRGRSIQQITKDHSAAELIGAKDESEINPMFRGMILRAVGIQPSVEVEATPLPLREGDRILICSDGLCKMVPDKRMLAIVRESDSPDGAVNALIAAANAAGGVDNVTVELIQIGKFPAALPVVAMPPVPASTGERATVDTGSTDAATQDTNSEGGVAFEPSSDGGDAQDGTKSTDDATCATMTIPEASDPDTDENTSSPDSETTTADTQDDHLAQRVAVSSKVVVIVSVALALAVSSTVVGVTMKNRAAARAAADAQRQAEMARAAEEARQAEEARKAEAARLEKEVAARREAERKAEQERILAEEGKKRREEQERIERERKEREEAQRQEKLRQEREKREAEKRAAAKLAQEEAERERQRIAAESAANELARQKAEADRRRKEAEEQKRSRDAQRRIEVLSAFEEVCEQDVAVAFVRKVSGILDKDLPEDLCVRFRPLTKQSALSQEQKLAAAVALATDLKTVVVKLTDYARVYLRDVEDQLTDPLTTSDYRRELKDVPKRMGEFLEQAQAVVSGDPSDPEVQFKCVLMIHSIPRWF